MMEAFRLGGWGMYPTLFAGVFSIVAALRFARAPGTGNLALVRQLSILTGLVATLGFVTGLIHCFTACGDASTADLQHFVVVGTGESLCNIGLGLVLLVMARAATAYGTMRGKSAGASLVDPQRP